MAFPIPSFLQFAPPEEAIADIGRLRESALNREQNREINLVELGLKRQQLGQQAAAQAAQQAERMQEMEFRQLALQNNMTRDAAALAQEKAKMDAEAQVAMIQFQGMQDFQRDVAAGLPFEQAIQRHIPKIAFGNPAALAGVANTMQRTKTQEEIAAERNDLSRFLRGEIDKSLSEAEAGRNKRAEDERNFKSKLEAERQKNRLEIIDKKLSLIAPKLNQVDSALLDAEKRELSLKGLDEEDFQKELSRIEAKYKSRIGVSPSTPAVRRFNPKTGKIE